MQIMLKFDFLSPSDTFASKVAAIQDQYADASIGNVTGSNAVNVFLGIGVSPAHLRMNLMFCGLWKCSGACHTATVVKTSMYVISRVLWAIASHLIQFDSANV